MGGVYPTLLWGGTRRRDGFTPLPSYSIFGAFFLWNSHPSFFSALRARNKENHRRGDVLCIFNIYFNSIFFLPKSPLSRKYLRT